MNGISFRILINTLDEEKKKIAYLIRDNLREVGIDIYVEEVSLQEIWQRIQDLDYDLVLADIDLNSNPDITYIEKNICLSDEIQSKIDEVKHSSIENLPSKIQELKDVLSSSVACLGICSKTTKVVYKKEFKGLNQVRFLNIFGDFTKIYKEN